MRGANINYANKQGKTALYIAVEHHVGVSTIEFLIKTGSSIHNEDKNYKDACEITMKNGYYLQTRVLWDRRCRNDPKLRVNFEEGQLRNIDEFKLKEKIRADYNEEL